MEKFYVHSEEFWGSTRQWAVFERLPWPDRWRRVSKFFLTPRPAEKLLDRMLADQRRYEQAMYEKRAAPLAVTIRD